MSNSVRISTTALNPQETKALFCCRMARSHCDAAELLSKTSLDNSAMIPPAVTLHAFSVELLLKAGILAQGNSKWGHDLSSLYEGLNDPIKRLATEQFKQLTNEELKAFLDREKTAFQEWRYVHEQNSATTSIENWQKAFSTIFAALAYTFPYFNRGEE